jgi:hypothetical protein
MAQVVAQSPSKFEEAILESNDQQRTVDIATSIVSFDYYEDIFSPTITATLKMINTGDSIPSANPDGSTDKNPQSVYNGLPLRGGERLRLKISPNTESNIAIDFSKSSKDYLYVSSITDVIAESQREAFTLHLTSREAITNETVRVGKKFAPDNSIDTSVKQILKNILKTDKFTNDSIERTTNKYGFIGNMRKPFTVLIWLASKGVPATSGDATAGFVFYQTKDGFNFRSIDNLIKQKPKAVYLYSQSIETYDDKGNAVKNDFKILKYTTEKNQNLIEKLKLGTYSSYRIFFNPLTFEFTNPQKGLFKLNDYVNKTSNLGEKIKLPKITSGSSKDLGETPTRIFTMCLDVGTLNKEPSKEVNASPEKYQSQSIMRYNILFTQTLSMVVPLNTNLSAGDVIKCNFPKISSQDGNELDEETSGLYMIKELCHHFDTESSYTSMKLVRDTFGINPEANKS